uniref:Vesicle transport protein USE1 n=2 Tax=Schistocephalus solidus TaxID=70667 RepID=A0A0V0J7Q6_SCHSO
MVMAVILETNFVRLLNCAEDLAEANETKAWRYSIYIEKLEEMLNGLSSVSPRPTAEFLHIYKARVKQLASLAEKSSGNSPLLTWVSSIPASFDRKQPQSCTHMMQFSYPSSRIEVSALSSVPHASSPDTPTPSASVTKPRTTTMRRYFTDAPDLLQREQAKLDQQLRRRLLGADVPGDASLVKENEEDGENKKPAYAGMLDDQMSRREHLANEMLGLTKELRLTSLAIGEKIRADIGVLEQSNELAQHNAASLVDVSRCLKEELGQKFGLVVWILFLVSIAVFFWMVLFMKFTKRLSP